MVVIVLESVAAFNPRGAQKGNLAFTEKEAIQRKKSACVELNTSFPR